MEAIISLLKETFTQGSITSSQRKELRRRIEEGNLEKNDRDFLRSQIFDMAKAAFVGQGQSHLLDWLEEANKLLLQSASASHNHEVHFSPGESCLQSIQNHLRSAGQSIKVCVFTISDDRLTEALLHAHRIGVQVKIITDDEKCGDEGSDIYRLAEVGIPVKTDRTPNHMHHKFAIVDDEMLITGSFNWTRSASSFNFENVLITSQPVLVDRYEREFDRLWDEMGDLA